MNATKLLNNENFLLFSSPLDPAALYARALALASEHNLGACVSFAGIIRAEANERGQAVAGLSFDVSAPLLAGWLGGWKVRENEQLKLFFAHARGDVMAGECSYFAAICARKRAEANALLPEFVEDFKRHAPIWKYDLVAAEGAASADTVGAAGGGAADAAATSPISATPVGAASTPLRRVYAAERSFSLPHAGLLAK